MQLIQSKSRLRTHTQDPTKTYDCFWVLENNKLYLGFFHPVDSVLVRVEKINNGLNYE